MNKLPVLLSIPHGGTEAPVELQDRIVLNQYDLHDDIDPFTRQIYDLGDGVTTVISTDIARTFVDLNRAPEQRPPQYPDGVVKSMTCLGQSIYKAGREPKGRLISKLLRHYYYPYHKRIEKTLQQPELRLALDCHSMLAFGPTISPDPGQRRPMICLGNGLGQTCPWELIDRLAGSVAEAFSLQRDEVTINRPFAGGYITRTYGKLPIPWIQVELNRALYLDPLWFDRESLQMKQDRLFELRESFEKALRLIFE
jgi:formiminoglutamase